MDEILEMDFLRIVFSRMYIVDALTIVVLSPFPSGNSEGNCGLPARQNKIDAGIPCGGTPALGPPIQRPPSSSSANAGGDACATKDAGGTPT